MSLETKTCKNQGRGFAGDDRDQLIEELKKALAAEKKQNVYLKRVASVYRQAALVDQLTGLLNRRAFDQYSERLFGLLPGADDKRKSVIPCIGLCMIDVDHFKLINDRHGHPIGDVVLKEVAGRVRQSLRTSDLVFRYGGEEIAVLLPGVSPEESTVVAEKVRQNVVHDVQSTPVTISIGVTCATRYVHPTSMVRAADEALYAAKNSGRNCVATKMLKQR